jgi:succinate dehydrogenase / fumarate reductase, membrane anchor subunit
VPVTQSASSRFSGLRAWWVQRLSAVYMLLFFVFLLVSLALRPPQSPDSWRHWVARPVVTLAFLVFFTALLAHTWVGLRDVMLDYARPAGLRKSLLAFVALGLLGMALWVLRIVLRLHS